LGLLCSSTSLQTNSQATPRVMRGSRYEDYYYCLKCVRYVHKDDSRGFPPRCPKCGRYLRTYPRRGKYKEQFRSEWLRKLKELSMEKGRRVQLKVEPKQKLRKLHPCKPRECPHCGSVSKRFFKTEEGWIRFCSTCGYKH